MSERDRRKLLARAKAYKLEGLSYRAIGVKLGVTGNVVRKLVEKERTRALDELPPAERAEVAWEGALRSASYKVPAPRDNDCDRHLALIAAARPEGFPALTLRPRTVYRRAA